MHASDVLAATLREARDAFPHEDESTRLLVGELLERLADEPPVDALLAVGEERRETLTDVLGTAARLLAADDGPTAEAAAAWEALVVALDRLHGSGVAALGRLPFVGDRLLELLVGEARARRREVEDAGRRAVGAPGRALASLAASPKLRDAVSAALGLDVVPAYQAVYLYDPPGSHVRTHVDARDYEVVFHLVLEHEPPRARSALVAHLPGGRERLLVRPGEAVVLRGRGTIHSWEALYDDERRTLTGIGFERAR